MNTPKKPYDGRYDYLAPAWRQETAEAMGFHVPEGYWEDLECRKAQEMDYIHNLQFTDDILPVTKTVVKETKEIEVTAKVPALPMTFFSDAEFAIPPPPPKFIIQDLLPCDVTTLIGSGGQGKSQLVIQMMVHIVLGQPFMGYPIHSPGPCVYLTAEDSRRRIQWRLWNLVKDMHLSPSQIERLLKHFGIVDLVGSGTKLVNVDAKGNLNISTLPSSVINACRSLQPSVVTFDPFVKFNPGERFVNDAEDMMVTACMQIQKELDCAVILVHHTGKQVYRQNIVDHYSGRGGSALGDGVRGAYQIVRDTNDPEIVTLFTTKLTDGKPPAPIMMRRINFKFEPHIREVADEQDHLELLINFMKSANPIYPTRQDIETLYQEIGIGRNQVRVALAKGILSGRIGEAPLPKERQWGSKKMFVFVPAAAE